MAIANFLADPAAREAAYESVLDLGFLNRQIALFGSLRIGPSDVLLFDLISGEKLIFDEEEIDALRLQYRDPVSNAVDPSRRQDIASEQFVSLLESRGFEYTNALKSLASLPGLASLADGVNSSAEFDQVLPILKAGLQANLLDLTGLLPAGTPAPAAAALKTLITTLPDAAQLQARVNQTILDLGFIDRQAGLWGALKIGASDLLLFELVSGERLIFDRQAVDSVRLQFRDPSSGQVDPSRFQDIATEQFVGLLESRGLEFSGALKTLAAVPGLGFLADGVSNLAEFDALLPILKSALQSNALDVTPFLPAGTPPGTGEALKTVLLNLPTSTTLVARGEALVDEALLVDNREAIKPLELSPSTFSLLYVACYGRPADVGGGEFWAGKLEAEGLSYSPRNGETLTQQEQLQFDRLIAAFANSDEATRLYGDLSNSQRVDQIYQHCFDRDAETDPLTGENYWLGKLNNGDIDFPELIAEVALGAQGSDLTHLTNKILSADRFTYAAGTTFPQLPYAGEQAAGIARTWLDQFERTAADASQVVGVISQISALAVG